MIAANINHAQTRQRVTHLPTHTVFTGFAQDKSLGVDRRTNGGYCYWLDVKSIFFHWHVLHADFRH
jgi:hypothetical protein